LHFSSALPSAGSWALGRLPNWKARFAARDGEARELDEKFRRAITELAAASVKAGQHDALAEEVGVIREERDTLAAQFAAAHERAGEAERMRAELGMARTDRENLRAAVGAPEGRWRRTLPSKSVCWSKRRKVCARNSRTPGTRCSNGRRRPSSPARSARFAESEKTSADRLKAALEPVGARLEKYEQQVQELEAKRVDGFGQLTGLIESDGAGQEAVRTAALQLGNSLRNGPKTRGRWGELQLRNVLEQWRT